MEKKEMGKLHELLAVETDLQGISKKIIEETVTTFTKKADHFTGFIKTYEPLRDEEDQLPETRKEIVDTVMDKLKYTSGKVGKYWDCVLQKEATNQTACADIIVDGKTIAEKIPATALLGLESKLKEFRNIIDCIPTLPPGIAWEEEKTLNDKGYIFKTKFPKETLRTIKQFKSQILVAPTEHHPAQIEKWEEPVVVGKYIESTICSCISPAKKSELLGKIDNLIQAVKKARQRANNTDVIKLNIADKLFDYIYG